MVLHPKSLLYHSHPIACHHCCWSRRCISSSNLYLFVTTNAGLTLYIVLIITPFRCAPCTITTRSTRLIIFLGFHRFSCFCNWFDLCIY
ncbi:hypothetical protein O6P43_006988 [Quillaja saponaria]|uniref:Uncharacterized protein n=1 Tax=Quillaja saponaria TaxID=32244 RepID=A0AAD7Q9S7_QUISA|nr:hypothetical protein O6P43_006988 [Quillaja saponaria]